MHILFDYQAFEIQTFGGVSHSYAELISHLRKVGCDCLLGIKECDNIYIKDKNIKPLHYTHDRLFGPKKRFWGQRTLTKIIMGMMGHSNGALSINKDFCIRLLKQHDIDIFEPTYYESYFLPYLQNKPFVMTVHDMIPEVIKYNDWQTQQKKLLCPLAAHIHVPSENTKKDLVNILGINPEKVSVTPHGAPPSPNIKYTSLYSFPYILYVGERWSYKNFEPFVEECKIIITRYSDVRVVCTGKPFDKKEQKFITDQGLSNHFIQHSASEEEMISLYQNAVVFVYPSEYEGFGMPILEAYSSGCPVLLNDASCFPEVGGNAALYFNIHRRGEMAEQFFILYESSQDDRYNLIIKGKEQMRKFSWDETAKRMKHIYASLI